jgi:hypothetical protein
MTVRVPMLLALTLIVFGCEKQEASSSDTPKHTDAGTPKGEVLDPSLAQAMAAASSAPAQANAQVEGGPPPNGVFAPGAADKEVAAGQPPKVTLGSQGSEPRIDFASIQPKPGTKQSGTIQVMQQSQGSGLPLEFALSIEVQKPKTDGAPVPVVARVTGVKLSLAGAPKELEAQVAKLKGARVDYEVLPDGAGTGFKLDVPKGAPAELADMVRSLSDTLAASTVPFPRKPIGVGGFWMATSRDGVLGLDLVTYRMIKVEKVTGNKVSLSVNTKRYSASSTFDLAGLPPDAPRSLAEFRSATEGNLEVEVGKPFPVGGTQTGALMASLQNATNPAARGTLEVRTRAELHF